MVLGIQCVGISQWVKLYESNFNTSTVKIVNNKVFNQIFYLLYGIVALWSQQLLEWNQDNKHETKLAQI